MEGISDIRIAGIDPKRPPRIQKMPCIDLVFRLTHKAPQDWCETFNLLMDKHPYSVRIDPAVGLFIETWVRKPDEVEKSFAALKKGIATCTEQYIKQIADKRARAEAAGAPASGETGPSEAQLVLDRAVASLAFDDV